MEKRDEIIILRVSKAERDYPPRFFAAPEDKTRAAY